MKICSYFWWIYLRSKFDGFGWTRLRLLYSSVLFIVLMVEKEQVVAKLLLNLSKSIIYSAVNTNANHNNRTIVFKTETNST